ncbi:hypothetical protein [Streptomyces sp. NPDC048349]|uniref:hypothetical protein n=1 Tax=Streptomyces sp. NPDC048349 TaxID=3155486 RepID=UPI0034260797
MDLLQACRGGRGLRTAALLRRAHPFDKELPIAGLVLDLGELLRPGDAASPRGHDVAEAVRPLLGERVARLLRLQGRDGYGGERRADAPAAAGPDGEAAANLRQAHDGAGAAGLEPGMPDDWRPVLELVAAGAYGALHGRNGNDPLGSPRGSIAGLP